mmetsp:Transcript_66236/g.158035  ORF Transcript_66236/g.158035 Transcript_66236/m.158035 type:complete len:287 (+) Transcript_66236:88-948(+)|eukprot:CAMPEP_0181452874 /NCGR_PEP_ID=MMETSP1110-20121109/29434_1 /TAXON_ID=174948 /ORGANISM="Symbiodinium sp., Strain CCMP421" /LENGTH=286 /DNA_ID=CAMNT_0023577175 /DNA_START=82 /DNA_END=942 /DNA_ORIENTATION=+
MGVFPLPIEVSCNSAGLGCAGLNGEPSLSLNLNVKVEIPLPELLSALTAFSEAKPSAKPGEGKSWFLMPEDDEVLSRLAVKKTEPASVPPPPPPKVAMKTPETGQVKVEAVQAQAKSTQLSSQQSSPSPAWEVLPLTAKQLECSTIRVTNLIRGLTQRQLEGLFAGQVGPVEKCTISDSSAHISFTEKRHAFSAVQKYDGGVLEVQAEQDKDARSLSLIPGPWGNTGAALRHMLSDIIGPLDQCHYRRGDCWLTVAEYGKVKTGHDKVKYKGSVIKVVLDTSETPD